MFLEDKIKANFPYLFGIEEKQDLFERMLQALKLNVLNKGSTESEKCTEFLPCDNISIQDKQYIYKAQLVVEEGDDPHFTEGVPFEFRTQHTIFNCEVVEFDYANAFYSFSSSRQVYM